MSADNWTTCPQCEDRAQKAWDVRVHAHAASYGLVSATAFTEEAAVIAAGMPKIDSMFREDYEFYFERDSDGIRVVASYSGHCQNQECRLSLDFEDSHALYPKES